MIIVYMVQSKKLCFINKYFVPGRAFDHLLPHRRHSCRRSRQRVTRKKQNKIAPPKEIRPLYNTFCIIKCGPEQKSNRRNNQ